MGTYYHDFSNPNPYLSTHPDDSGLRYRLSGDLLYIYATARACEGYLDQGISRRKKRDRIVKFSESAGSRMGRYLRESVADYRYMHTLTYPREFCTNGEACKYHLRRYLQELSRISVRNGRGRTCSHFWFLEFQRRGAPHFHILTTDFYSYRRCAELWFRIVASGDEKHLKAGVRVEKIRSGRSGMQKYVKKYAIKQYQKQVPEEFYNVGRFWGINGVKKRVAADTVFYADSLRDGQISVIKGKIDSLITYFQSIHAIVMKKRSFGFVMWHVANKELVYFHLRSLFQESNIMQIVEIDGVNGDCELTNYAAVYYGHDRFTGEPLDYSAKYRQESRGV